jgi:hypothetical protein
LNPVYRKKGTGESFSNIKESTGNTKPIISRQEKMKSIFHTVEMIRRDLTKCGVRLLEPAKFLGFPLFVNSDYSFRVIYGIANEMLRVDAKEGETSVTINRNIFFKKGSTTPTHSRSAGCRSSGGGISKVCRKNKVSKGISKKGKSILIYDPEYRNYEVNEIRSVDDYQLILETGLQHDYTINSSLVVLRDVEYRHYAEQNILKRKINKGYFRPLIKEVTDFYVKFFPESCSVLYRIEIEKKEQIRGYIFMENMKENK